MTLIVGALLVAALVAMVLGLIAHYNDNHVDPWQRLRHEHALMRETLYWYAERSHWRRRHPRGGRHWANAPAVVDRGARAMAVVTLVDAGVRHGA